MSETSQNTSDIYFSRVREIQAHCCCHEIHERDCYRQRYSRSVDDCFRYEDEDLDDSVCECACHIEILELERDLFPDEEFQ